MKCHDSDYGFRIRCNIKDSECIVTVLEPHQCLPDAPDSWRVPASMKYLQPANQDFFDNAAHLEPKHLVLLEGTKGNRVGYQQGWRALNAHRDKASGDDVCSFNKPPSLLYRFKKVDANTYYRLESSDGRLHRLFFAPNPCHKAFPYSRRFMALDGTFWKATFEMTLLVAVVLDGNNEILPFAFSITTSEPQDNWQFFLSNSKRVVPEVNEQLVTVISDSGKGRQASMTSEFGAAYQCHCVQHLCENVMRTFHPGEKNFLVCRESTKPTSV